MVAVCPAKLLNIKQLLFHASARMVVHLVRAESIRCKQNLTIHVTAMPELWDLLAWGEAHGVRQFKSRTPRSYPSQNFEPESRKEPLVSQLDFYQNRYSCSGPTPAILPVWTSQL